MTCIDYITSMRRYLWGPWRTWILRPAAFPSSQPLQLRSNSTCAGRNARAALTEEAFLHRDCTAAWFEYASKGEREGW